MRSMTRSGRLTSDHLELRWRGAEDGGRSFVGSPNTWPSGSSSLPLIDGIYLSDLCCPACISPFGLFESWVQRGRTGDPLFEGGTHRSPTRQGERERKAAPEQDQPGRTTTTPESAQFDEQLLRRETGLEVRQG